MRESARRRRPISGRFFAAGAESQINRVFSNGSEPRRHHQGVLSATNYRHALASHEQLGPASVSRREPALTRSELLELHRLSSSDSLDATLQLRARIILSWAAGATGEQSANLLATSRRTVSKWRARFREGGIEALVDRPRPGAPRTIAAAKIVEVLRLRKSPPPSGKSRWTTRMIAQRTGLSQSTVVRIARDYVDRL